MFITLSSIFLNGCNEAPSNPATEIEVVNELQTESDSFEVSVSESTDALAASNNWQIDTYVPYIMGESIAMDAKSISNEEGIFWYYQKLDVAGGFASLTGALEGWKEFALWRKDDGQDLIGEMTVGCGPACDYDFKFYSGIGKEIEEVPLKSLVPVAEFEKTKSKIWDNILEKYPTDYPEDCQFRFIFPEKGTDMQVDLVLGADEIQIPFALLGWNKITFFVKKYLGDFAEA